MFTGIVEERGRVLALTPTAGGTRLRIAADAVLADAVPGASIAVNGVCLTVTALGEGWWEADAVVETIERSSLGALASGDPVNLERPLRLADRLGGHLVQGHVDGVGVVKSRVPESDGSERVVVAIAPSLVRYVVEKGSITVDGVSLTVAAVHDGEPAARVAAIAAGDAVSVTGVGPTFEVAVIPHTLAVTTLGGLRPEARVNLEVDVLAKYVERLMAVTPAAPPVPSAPVIPVGASSPSVSSTVGVDAPGPQPPDEEA